MSICCCCSGRWLQQSERCSHPTPPLTSSSDAASSNSTCFMCQSEPARQGCHRRIEMLSLLFLSSCCNPSCDSGSLQACLPVEGLVVRGHFRCGQLDQNKAARQQPYSTAAIVQLHGSAQLHCSGPCLSQWQTTPGPAAKPRRTNRVVKGIFIAYKPCIADFLRLIGAWSTEPTYWLSLREPEGERKT